MDLHNSFKRAMQVFFLFSTRFLATGYPYNSSLIQFLHQSHRARRCATYIWGDVCFLIFLSFLSKGTLGVGVVHKKLKGVDLFDQSIIANICRKKEGWSVGDSEHLRQLSSHRTRTI